MLTKTHARGYYRFLIAFLKRVGWSDRADSKL
jgi:hypothetical protein